MGLIVVNTRGRTPRHLLFHTALACHTLKRIAGLCSVRVYWLHVFDKHLIATISVIVQVVCEY